MAITGRPQSSRSPSLLLADVRVLFVNHGRIGTACSGMAHRSGRRGSDRSRHTQSAAGPTRKPRAFPHRTELGSRPCPCSFRAAPHCLFQAVAHDCGSPQPSRGTRAHPKPKSGPTPQRFGQTSALLSASGRPALLVPSSGTRFRVPRSRAGAPARVPLPACFLRVMRMP